MGSKGSEESYSVNRMGFVGLMKRYNANTMGSEGSLERNDWMRNLEKRDFIIFNSHVDLN